MRRLLLNIGSGLSALLLVAMAVLCVRSFWRISTCEFKRSKWISETHLQKMTLDAQLDYGRWRLKHTVFDDTFDQEFIRHNAFIHGDSPDRLGASYRLDDGVSAEWHNNSQGLRILGFSLDTGSGTGVLGNGVENWTSLGVPGWAPVALMSILPIIWSVRAYSAGEKRKPGHCRGCGYSLLGNVTGICPECGAKGKAENVQPVTR